MRKCIGLALALLLGVVPAGLAQVSTGNIYGSVADESGAVLPGVTVTLSGEYGTRTTTSSSDGQFRFLGVENGRYKMVVALTGFTTVNREVVVVTGQNANLSFGMKVASVEETVTVTAETPIVDTKRRGTATTLETSELEKTPNARDPWGVLKNVPGVVLDRVNIAGNENGQQASAAGKGSANTDKMWNIDGLSVTDMSATGASPSYYDFEAFREIAVTTGGADLTVQSGGIGINLVTKRGTNAFHGGARMLLAHDDMQSGNVPDSLSADPRLVNPDGTFRDKADHIQQISDYGFELGGPIVKDKLWFFGTYGKQDIRLTRLNGTPDKTLLPSYNGKLNWQATGSTMVSAFYFVGKKQKFGRAPSVPVQGVDGFNWDQDDAYVEGGMPGGLWKAEVNHTFSPNFFVSAKAAYYDTGFGLTARGGADQSYTLDYVNGVGLGSYADYEAIRPQKTANLDANYFFSGLGGNNELKFGFGYRTVTTDSGSSYNGNQLVGVINGVGAGDRVAKVFRNRRVVNGGKYWSGYLGDVLSRGRFTANAGLRLDHQTAKNLESSVPANASFASLLPGLTVPADEQDLQNWTTLSPRVGVSFALDEGRKTVLRASYASYYEQLAFGDVGDENRAALSYLAYGWNDSNNDNFVQPGEVNLGGGVLYSANVNPANPSQVGDTVNKIDRDRDPKRDHEFVLGIDRELSPNFAIGAAYTWRNATNWTYRPRLGGACTGDASLSNCPIIGPNDYTANAPRTFNGYTGVTYSPSAALVGAGSSGRIRTNRPGYTTTYNGLELTLNKRLANKWMGRIAFSFNDWVENFDGTPVARGNGATGALGGSPGRNEQDALVDGGQVAALSGGSGKASFYTSIKWQLYANGLVQLPWSFDLSAAVFARQGGPYPISVRIPAGVDGSAIPAFTQDTIDTNRYDDLWNIDLRLAKNMKLGGSTLTLSAELFNVFNNSLVLSRWRYAEAAAFTATASGAESGLGRIEEIISPRILRVGARFSF
ncbi:MAG TPA: carboxypeptidase regulatory-like domain-containing protein [Vicinamibacteria bacterium]